jgi:hypothetical protein
MIAFEEPDPAVDSRSACRRTHRVVADRQVLLSVLRQRVSACIGAVAKGLIRPVGLILAAVASAS